MLAPSLVLAYWMRGSMVGLFYAIGAGDARRTAYNVRVPDDNPRLLSEVHAGIRCLVPFDTGGDEAGQLALHVPLAVAVDHQDFHVTVAGEVQNLL